MWDGGKNSKCYDNEVMVRERGGRTGNKIFFVDFKFTMPKENLYSRDMI